MPPNSTDDDGYKNNDIFFMRSFNADDGNELALRPINKTF